MATKYRLEISAREAEVLAMALAQAQDTWADELRDDPDYCDRSQADIDAAGELEVVFNALLVAPAARCRIASCDREPVAKWTHCKRHYSAGRRATSDRG